MNFQLGADPEFFLLAGEEHVSAHDVVPGTKDQPAKIPHGFVQADGTAVEFNTIPAKSATEFATNVGDVLTDLRGIIPEKYTFSFTPVVRYSKQAWAVVPPKSKELGCDPDYAAWMNGDPNIIPDNIGTMRTGAGHLHVSWGSDFDKNSKSHKWDCMHIVQALEQTVIHYSRLWDHDTERQHYYGGNGAFRPKSYGVEWRGPSNAWLNYPKIWPWLYQATEAVVRAADKGLTSSMKIGRWNDAVSNIVYYTNSPVQEKVKQLNEYVCNRLTGWDMPPMPEDALGYEEPKPIAKPSNLYTYSTTPMRWSV